MRITLPWLLAGAVVLAACGAPKDPAAGNGLPTAAPVNVAGRIDVVAAESLWGNIAAQIGGRHVAVTSILSDPAQDPHDYESGLGDAVKVAHAKLVIVNGAGYDNFMNRLLDADGHRGAVVDAAAAAGISSSDNPHIWYDPAATSRVAAAIATALSRLDAAHAATYRQGLAAFRMGERRVIAVIDEIKRRHAAVKVGYTESVPAYLVRAAGLRLGTPGGFSNALQNGIDPSPGDSARFEQAITSHAIRVLLLNSQTSDPETARLRRLARARGVPVVAVTETLPIGTDFQTWQADEATALLRALDG